MNVVMAPGILDAVIDHAKECYPNEGCGLLVGRGSAERFIAITNIAPRPSEFEMDPAQLIGALRNFRTTGEDLIAIYHSHPHGPAQPSKLDIERAEYPEAAHLIISLADRESPLALAFRIVDGGAFPVELHVIV